MSNLTNQVESYIKQLLNKSKNNIIEIRRNELALELRCVPSQINYVLQTRFSPERGYKIESQRGGGGYIRITKITTAASQTISSLTHILERGISHSQCRDLLLRLEESGIFTKREGKILLEITKADVLGVPLPLRDKIRANILKQAILKIID